MEDRGIQHESDSSPHVLSEDRHDTMEDRGIQHIRPPKLAVQAVRITWGGMGGHSN